ncbi:sulfatase [Alphaproteobacteria bacterium LSUCC0396]
MRTVFVLFDSLNRLALECYGGMNVTPNFARLARHGVTFDTHYVGSLPCMPARREINTGRHNFLHRSWGPLEPFDVSFVEKLQKNGTYTHLISDHYHYWSDGGATYHSRFSSWEFLRGQAWDPFSALVEPPVGMAARYHPMQQQRHQGMVNREFVNSETDYSLVKCFERAFHFLDNNRQSDNWFIQLECFDPHEPFMAPDRFKSLYPSDYDGPILDWPLYKRVDESPQEINELRANYAALLTMCDWYLGKLLDYFDEHDLWKDTSLIVTTDHGFLLGEHDWWAKSRMPFFEEVSHIPLIIYHPDFVDHAGERRSALTQTIDLMPTFLEIHGCLLPETVQGVSLLPLLGGDQKIREAGIFGRFAAATNITDGRYTYFRYPEDMENQNLWEYTLMPTHQKGLFADIEFEGATLVKPFAFLGNFPVMRLPAGRALVKGQGAQIEDTVTVLYDLESDPDQQNPINDPVTEERLIAEMIKIMQQTEAPPEAYARLGFDTPAERVRR